MHVTTWACGEGTFLVDKRWNSEAVRAIYASLYPATAIMEIIVQKGFVMLRTKHHVLTSCRNPALATSG